MHDDGVDTVVYVVDFRAMRVHELRHSIIVGKAPLGKEEAEVVVGRIRKSAPVG